MPIDCDDCAEQMAILEAELAACNALIAEICAAFLTETDPMARMGVAVRLSVAYQAKAEIEYDITIVTMNQIELGCIQMMKQIEDLVAEIAKENLGSFRKIEAIQKKLKSLRKKKAK